MIDIGMTVDGEEVVKEEGQYGDNSYLQASTTYAGMFQKIDRSINIVSKISLKLLYSSYDYVQRVYLLIQ